MLIISLINHKLELEILKQWVPINVSLIANDDEDKANIISDYFTGVYTRESKDEFNELPPRSLAFPCDDLFFSEEVIIDKLNNVKVNKSPGPDSLHPCIIYEVRHK